MGGGICCPAPPCPTEWPLPPDNHFDFVCRYASKDIKILVVANPANTNCLILKSAAPSIAAENFSALTYLDHNRARAQIAIRLNTAVENVTKTCIWGNHSSTQVPDANNGVVTIDGVTRSIPEAIGDDAWLAGPFVKTVQTRGAAVIKARKLSSAMSVRNAARTKKTSDHHRTPPRSSARPSSPLCAKLIHSLCCPAGRCYFRLPTRSPATFAPGSLPGPPRTTLPRLPSSLTAATASRRG